MRQRKMGRFLINLIKNIQRLKNEKGSELFHLVFFINFDLELCKFLNNFNFLTFLTFQFFRLQMI